MTIQVALVDGQAMVRAGLRLIMDRERDLDVVAEAETASEAVDLTLRLRPEVVVMDIRLPGADGIETARRLSDLGCASKVLLLATSCDDDVLFRALRSGTSGFLLKSASAQDLVTAVRTVAAGQAVLSPAVVGRVMGSFTNPHEPSGGAAALTPRETEVLCLLARGLSNGEIAAQLVLGTATVKTHVARVLTKLNLHDRTQAVVYAYEHGLVSPGG